MLHLTRCGPRITHVGEIPLKLLRCTPHQMEGSQVSWDMAVYSLTGIPVKEREGLAFVQRIAFIVLFS